MRKLAKYLKMHIWLLVFCFVMLAAQAICNLMLPSLMSDIINVGIQHEGIAEQSPKAMSKEGYSFTLAFANEQDKETIENSYDLIRSTSAAALRYKDSYPALKTDDVYIQKDLKKDKQEEIDKAFERSMVTVLFLLSEIKNYTGVQDATTSANSINDLKLEQLYVLLPEVSQLPDSVLQSLEQKAQDLDGTILSSMGSVVTKLFYENLNVDIFELQRDYIVKIGLQMLVLTAISAITAILVSLNAARIGAAVSKSLRHDVFEKVQHYSNKELDKFSTASLITRTTNDITQVQNLLVMGIRLICYAPIMGVGGIILALRESLSMGWIIALAVVLLLGLIWIVFSSTMPKYQLMQKFTDRINLITRENLSGTMVIRAFGTQGFEEDRFDKANKDLTKVNLFVNRVVVLLMPMMTLFMNLFCVLIVWVGANEIANSGMEIGNMMAFMQYVIMVAMSFLMISVMFIMVPRSSVSAERIAEVINEELSINDPDDPQHISKDDRGTVEFKDVNFRYGNADHCALENINFTANTGEMTAFIGSTGSGKTTLVNLIPRFYDVESGEVLVNGVNVKNLTQKELRDCVGLVPQKGVLFSGTIESNLRYGDEGATQEDLEEAVSIAQAMEFINSKPKRFETPIAQGGENVSGGQKQRLCIARALVKKAPIYVFDDSFSALDFKTDAALRKELMKSTKNSAVLVVAQRISTIMDAQKIIVLDEGRIVGQGTHKELIKTCKTYKEIAESQLTKEDMEK